MSEPSVAQTKEAGGAPLPATQDLFAQRLTAVESAVSELQRRLATLPPAPDWVEQISGAFKDDPAFEEVVALGRAFRMAEPFPEPPRRVREVSARHGPHQCAPAAGGTSVYDAAEPHGAAFPDRYRRVHCKPA